MPSGSHATQSHQRSRNRTPPTQTFPLHLVQRERVDILRVASYKQDCHSYHLRRSASKIGRRSSRKTVETRRSIVHFLHDNARPHVASGIHQKIAELDRNPVTHPSYSSGLALPDYHLFRPLKLHLRKKKFDKYDLKSGLPTFFAPKSPSFYKQGIDALPIRWGYIGDHNGAYFVD